MKLFRGNHSVGGPGGGGEGGLGSRISRGIDRNGVPLSKRMFFNAHSKLSLRTLVKACKRLHCSSLHLFDSSMRCG